MSYLYVVSNPEHIQVNKYKIGIHTGSLDDFLKRYITYLPEVQILLFLCITNAKEIETDLKKLFDEERVNNIKGNKSEWIQIPLEAILSVVADYMKNYNNLTDEERKEIELRKVQQQEEIKRLQKEKEEEKAQKEAEKLRKKEEEKAIRDIERMKKKEEEKAIRDVERMKKKEEEKAQKEAERIKKKEEEAMERLRKKEEEKAEKMKKKEEEKAMKNWNKSKSPKNTSVLPKNEILDLLNSLQKELEKYNNANSNNSYLKNARILLVSEIKTFTGLQLSKIWDCVCKVITDVDSMVSTPDMSNFYAIKNLMGQFQNLALTQPQLFKKPLIINTDCISPNELDRFQRYWQHKNFEPKVRENWNKLGKISYIEKIKLIGF